MSKLNNNKINFNDDNFIVSFENISETINDELQEDADIVSQEELEKNRIEKLKNDIILSAQKEKEEILDSANKRKEEIIEKAQQEAQEIINNATQEALKQEDEAKVQAQSILENSKDELEQLRIKTTNDAYQDGYKDGLSKIQEELEEKIKDFDVFCSNNFEVKNKIIKSASNDILDIISAISKKVLLSEVNAEIIDKIIQKAISLIEKKENINIILSTKYAKLLFELQKKSLNEETELKFEDFKQYQGFNVIYNSKYAPDTIIIESIKERLDASITSQLEVIINEMYEKSTEQPDLEQDIKNDEIN